MSDHYYTRKPGVQQNRQKHETELRGVTISVHDGQRCFFQERD